MTFDRREFSRGLGLGALGLLLPSGFTRQVEAAPNVLTWHDYAEADLKAALDRSAAAGGRTISLSVYGEPNDPRYAAIMLKEQAPVREERFLSLNSAAFKATFDKMSAQGWGPFIVSATGPVEKPRFAAVFRPIAPTPLTRTTLTAAEMAKVNETAMKDGAILQWADAYGTPANIRYIATWHSNADNAAWNCEALNDGAAASQRRAKAFVSGWSRPAHIAVTPSLGTLDLYVDTKVGRWIARRGLTRAQYEQEAKTYRAQGLAPVRLSAAGNGASRRYAALFVEREKPVARVFRVSGSPSVPSVDSVVEAFMKANQVRGASLAFVQGTRLVYAKGYTWAEPDYPDTQPTTFFRQASVAKTFTAVATHRLIQQGKLSLDTTMQSVLKLKTPTGGAPVDPNFEKITIRHLLDMTSGIDRGTVIYRKPAVEAFKTTLPVTRAQLMSYCASLKLVGKPGDKGAAFYNNGGYFLLGEVVARVVGVSMVDEAFKRLVLDPLGIKRVRSSRTLIEMQPSDEARYHPRPLAIGRSNMSRDQPLVLRGYGESHLENGIGTGGLSGAPTDVARLVAAFSLRRNNPLLDDAAMTAMFAAAAAATADNPKKAKGFHGFDATHPIDADKGLYRATKEGLLSTSQNWISVEREGWSFVICFNGRTPSGDGRGLEAMLSDARHRDWRNVDLFPQYGMASFKA